MIFKKLPNIFAISVSFDNCRKQDRLAQQNFLIHLKILMRFIFQQSEVDILDRNIWNSLTNNAGEYNKDLLPDPGDIINFMEDRPSILIDPREGIHGEMELQHLSVVKDEVTGYHHDTHHPSSPPVQMSKGKNSQIRASRGNVAPPSLRLLAMGGYQLQHTEAGPDARGGELLQHQVPSPGVRAGVWGGDQGGARDVPGRGEPAVRTRRVPAGL